MHADSIVWSYDTERVPTVDVSAVILSFLSQEILQKWQNLEGMENLEGTRGEIGFIQEGLWDLNNLPGSSKSVSSHCVLPLAPSWRRAKAEPSENGESTKDFEGVDEWRRRERAREAERDEEGQTGALGSVSGLACRHLFNCLGYFSHLQINIRMRLTQKDTLSTLQIAIWSSSSSCFMRSSRIWKGDFLYNI